PGRRSARHAVATRQKQRRTGASGPGRVDRSRTEPTDRSGGDRGHADTQDVRATGITPSGDGSAATGDDGRETILPVATVPRRASGRPRAVFRAAPYDSLTVAATQIPRAGLATKTVEFLRVPGGSAAST